MIRFLNKSSVRNYADKVLIYQLIKSKIKSRLKKIEFNKAVKRRKTRRIRFLYFKEEKNKNQKKF